MAPRLKAALVGVGPGSPQLVTPAARRAVANADIVLGWDPDLKPVEDCLNGKKVFVRNRNYVRATRAGVREAKPGRGEPRRGASAVAPMAASRIKQGKEQLMSYLVVLLSVLTRFIPHMPNFSPVFGALLFGGAHLKRRDAIWYPVALLAVSDVVLTTLVYRMRLGWGQSIVWLGFAAVALIGCLLRNRESVARIGVATVVGPTAFFVISNFGVWLGGRLYPASWDGLVACYLAAVPFYRNSLLASVAYAALFFGGYEIYRRRHIGLASTARAS